MMTLYARQQKRHTDKRFWILWEKVEGGMIWENSTEELMLLNCGVGEDSWMSLGLQEGPTNPF